MDQTNLSSSKKIALAGILTALGAATLLLENLFPTGKLGFYVLAGFILSIVIMECGLSFGWISYGVVSLVAFLLVPEKTAVFPYLLFFGLYALVKSHIEHLNKLIAEWILKYVFFNGSLYLMWHFATSILKLIPDKLIQQLPVFVTVLLLQIAFFAFDWLFTFWTQYYLKKISPKVHGRDSTL